MLFTCLLKFQPESGYRRPLAAHNTGYHRLAMTSLQHPDGLPLLFCGQSCHENKILLPYLNCLLCSFTPVQTAFCSTKIGFCTLDFVLNESRPTTTMAYTDIKMCRTRKSKVWCSYLFWFKSYSRKSCWVGSLGEYVISPDKAHFLGPCLAEGNGDGGHIAFRCGVMCLCACVIHNRGLTNLLV